MKEQTVLWLKATSVLLLTVTLPTTLVFGISSTSKQHAAYQRLLFSFVLLRFN
jgi:hypothetical protein